MAEKQRLIWEEEKRKNEQRIVDEKRKRDQQIEDEKRERTARLKKISSVQRSDQKEMAPPPKPSTPPKPEVKDWKQS